MAFPTTSVLDDFNRADGAVGAAWSILKLTGATAALHITSNQVDYTAFDNGGYWNAGTFGPDTEVFYTVQSVSNQDQTLWVRTVSPGASPSGYTVNANTAVGGTHISRWDSGVETVLGAGFSASLSAGDKLGLEIIGSTITAYKFTAGSWATLTSRSDATYSAAGNIGLYGQNTPDAGDDFGGGTVVGGVITVPNLRVVVGNRW